MVISESWIEIVAIALKNWKYIEQNNLSEGNCCDLGHLSFFRCTGVQVYNRGCLVRFTHMWYQISPCSWLGFWHLSQFKLRLGNHISDLRSQNWGQHSGFSEENRPKVGFFWKFQKMQFPAFGFKKWDFFWVWGVEKGPTNFFPCQKA